MTNPLQHIPARARAGVYLAALVIGVIVPFVIPDVPVVWQHVLQALGAVAALFAGSQGLSNLTPDTDNTAIQTKLRRAADTE